MSKGNIAIRCPGCGNANMVGFAVGQQFQCSVCQTVFFAPVIDPQRQAAPPLPGSGPSLNPVAAAMGGVEETREHAPAALPATDTTARKTTSRSWRTAELEPAAPVPTLATTPSGNLDSPPVVPQPLTAMPATEEPAAGRVWTVVSVFAGLLIVVTSLLTGVHFFRDWQQSGGRPVGSSQVAARSEPVASSVREVPVHWSDAALHAQRLGLLEVKVVRVKYGAVRAKDLNNEVITTDDTSLLAITLSVHNRGAVACEFRSWYAGGFESEQGQELLPELADDLERFHSLVRFDDVSSIEGQRLADEIEPHQTVQDTVVFLLPPEIDRTTIRYFRLSLPAHAIGTDDFFRFEIPVGMVDGWSGAEE
ncbi:MAG: hypothetical protein ACYC0X_29860 [Pirellulaceae bacterium]